MTVTRDVWGVPHIAAATEAEAFRALGYAQAEDHLPLILRHFTLVRSEAAARYGPKGLPSDRSQHRWQHLAASRRQLALLAPEDRALYEAFMAGIGAYLAEHLDEHSAPLPSLEAALPIAVYRMFLWHFMVVDALEAATSGGVLDPDVVADLAAMINLESSASNEIVVLPGHVREGATVVVSDPHGPIGEFPMFEYRLRAGRFDVIGVSAAGALPAILGHTSGVGWGSTTGAPRVSDCYLLPTRADGREYRRGDDWVPLNPRTVTVDVAGAEPEALTLESVQLNGIDCPVIGRDGDRIAVACTPYMAETMRSMDETLLRWAAARDIKELEAGAALLSMFPSNIMAGDRHGDAFYVRLGLTPRRGTDVNPTLPIEGYDQRTRWHGYHDFDELVQARNPACGYMQNNNVSPDTMFPGAERTELGAERHPAYLFNDRSGRSNDRGLRTEEVLGNGPVSVDEVLALALSDRWPTAPRWRDALARAVSVLGTAGWSAAEREFLEALLAFDGACAPESRGALAYYYWRTSIPLVVDVQPRADAGETTVWRVPTGVADERYARSREIWRAVESGTDLDAEQQRALVGAVRLAARRLVDETERTDACFGDVFRIGRGERDWPARSIAFPAYVPELEPATEFVMPMRAMAALPDTAGTRRIVSGGRSFRVVAFTEPIRSYSVVLYGQSSRPGSPHFSDQCALYSAGEARETGFASILPPASEER